MLIDDPTSLPLELQSVFQPIFSPADVPRPYGAEGLTRGPRGSSLEAPAALFQWARLCRMEVELDHACIRACCREARLLPQTQSLFLNVHARSLVEPGFAERLHQALSANSIAPARVVLEVLEHPQETPGAFSRTVEELRTQAIRLAVDDFGAGSSNLLRLLEYRPDFIKIERSFVTGCDHDLLRAHLLEGFVHIARSLGSFTIAEGVETAAELQLLQSVGVDFVQGYFLCRPVPVEDLPPRVLAGAGEPSADETTRR